MTQEEKSLLLKDLCGRLPYHTKVSVAYWVSHDGNFELEWYKKELTSSLFHDIEEDDSWEYIKPCLRSMSSMTWDERKEYLAECDKDNEATLSAPHYHGIDWLDRNMFDYRGLIPHGLAIEITEENNPYKE